jgi:hydroxymethylglutaryl-CoA lyase
MDEAEVLIRDVTLRDGLQNLPEYIPAEVKIALFRQIAASGVRRIECTAFVNPKAVPQFVDAGQVVRSLLAEKPDGVELAALVPNLKGAQLAIASGVRRLEFVMSVSESHNYSNVRRTTAQSLEELRRILELQASCPELRVTAGMATAFGCPFEGKISPEVILRFARQYYALGIRHMALADTVGFGNPRGVRDVCRLCRSEFPEVTFSIHLHNTRGLGPANAVAAYEAGIRIFDGAVGGLGGCPFAPGARGNTATEDLVYLFEEMGCPTGIKIEALRTVALTLREHKPDLRFASFIFDVGVPRPLGARTSDGTGQQWC